ncbi:M15 family metallopeptidase [Sphaerisporangium aureirubrum]|uniref:D-alanyl-D-alanine dipeptidase n=1 Tax=Sphaerisporangium aureirubrum TaxID=1544736 RepID=A0ABW1NHE8_9ACTN
MSPPPVLLSDRRISDLPVRESGEPLVDLRATGAVRVDARLADPRGAYAHLRSGAAERLLAAQDLLPGGIRLLVVEGFRPTSLQHRYFEESLAELRAVRSGWEEDRLRAETARYISPPEVAPHVAGAAVDVTLCTVSGAELPMGTEVNETPVGGEGPCYLDWPGLPPDVAANRRTLADAMTAAGFVNYPTEWWHWSYGDRYWAFSSGAPAALYGAAEFG